MKTRSRAAAAALVLIFLLLSACSDREGRTDLYEGFSVRTERSETSGEAEKERALPAQRSTPETERAEDFVLNKSSKRFHYPWCSSVREIAESNRWEYRGTRESVMEMGYEPCKRCSP